MQIKPNDILFPVVEVPAIGKFPKNANYTQEDTKSTGYKFIMREDTGQVLSCMTNNYKLVKNEDIYKVANKVVKKHNGVAKEIRSFSGGSKSIMRWHFPDHVVNIGNKDLIHPEVTIKNSYDGTIGVNVIAGAFRLVCSNGAVIGVVIEKYKNKHIMSNIALENIEQVITETIEKTTILFKKEFPILHQTKIREDHLLDLIGLFPSTMSSFLTQKLIADRPKTFWDLFNVATYITTHNMERSNEATHKLEDNIYKIMRNLAMREKARA